MDIKEELKKIKERRKALKALAKTDGPEYAELEAAELDMAEIALRIKGMKTSIANLKKKISGKVKGATKLKGALEVSR